MPSYNYIFMNLGNGDDVIAEIPLFGVYGQRVLNGAGQFNGSFQLDQTGKRNSDLIAATIPGRTWYVMERNGVPVMWGIVWSRTYQSQAKICQLFGWGFEVYPTRQLIISDIFNTGDECSMFTYLWNHMQSSALGRNISINIPSAPFSGVSKSIDTLASDYKYYGDVMSSLADASDGFDWTIQASRNGASYRKDLIVGYPTIGAKQDPSNLTFEYPGQILNYYESEGMADAGTNIFGFGSGEGESKIVSTVAWTDLLNSGHPRWDIEVDMTDVSDQTNLTGLTLQEANKRKPPMNTYTITLKGDKVPEFGGYSIGDNCRLHIKDPKHPDGFDVNTRIIGFELRPEDSQQSEEVDLILPGDQV